MIHTSMKKLQNMETRKFKRNTNWSPLVNFNTVIQWHMQAAAIIISVCFLSSCKQKMGKVLESETHVMIEMPNYRLLVQKEGFRLNFRIRTNKLLFLHISKVGCRSAHLLKI
jgi:hypothetical protein